METELLDEGVGVYVGLADQVVDLLLPLGCRTSSGLESRANYFMAQSYMYEV